MLYHWYTSQFGYATLSGTQTATAVLLNQH